MKLLVVVEHFPPAVGGVEKLFASLAQSFVSAGMEVDVVTLRLPQTEAFEEKDGVRIHRVRAFHRFLFTFLAFFRVFRLAKSTDLIHTTTYNAALPAWLAARLRGKKIVLTVHEVLTEKWYQLQGLSRVLAWFYRWYERLLFCLPFDRYVCVSKATRRDLLASFFVSADVVEVVYNGIDYEVWKRSHRSLRGRKSNTFVYAGRSGYTKGLFVLLQAWRKVVDERSGLKLRLILSRNPASGYRRVLQVLEELSLQDSVEVFDPLPEAGLRAALTEADCVVIPSLTEGFGFSVVENAALGNRVVATRAGSIPEVISGEHVLCKAGDVEGLRKALLVAADGQFESTPLKRFELGETVMGYRRVYETLI